MKLNILLNVEENPSYHCFKECEKTEGDPDRSEH